MTTKNNNILSRNSESCNEVLCNIQCSPTEQIKVKLKNLELYLIEKEF